ncbi:hypothetical protein K438DRAFT_1766238 [Mycena galopus ATCC 62051]|nr:hypothetical protein K438DRAFT_1766238 [Mycena galopus ATCC 62051]
MWYRWLWLLWWLNNGETRWFCSKPEHFLLFLCNEFEECYRAHSGPQDGSLHGEPVQEDTRGNSTAATDASLSELMAANKVNLSYYVNPRPCMFTVLEPKPSGSAWFPISSPREMRGDVIFGDFRYFRAL